MKSLKYVLLVLLSMAATRGHVQAQDPDERSGNILHRYGAAYQKALHNKLDRFDKQLLKAKLHFLKKLHRHNTTLAKKLHGPGEPLMDTQAIIARATGAGGLAAATGRSTTYIAYLDTLQNSLSFLQSMPGMQTVAANRALLQNQALLQNVQQHLGDVDKIGALLKDQQTLLQQATGTIKKEATAYLQSISKEYYYFSQTLKNYKDILSDPSRIEKKVLEVLRESPVFQSFLQKHSALAGLFNIPGGDPGSLAGLQTRQVLQQIVSERTSFQSINATGMLSGQVQAARSKLDELKQNITGNNTNGDLPDFKPRHVKSKTLLQRIELGSHIKFTGRNYALPVRSEMMFSAGYQFSDKISMGLGMTYWLGLGADIRHLAISHQGTGITSYYRMQFKRNLFVSGGWEQHYFNRYLMPGDLNTHSGWKNSALLGLGKKVPLGKSFLKGKWGGDRMKNSYITLLYDFLYRQQAPQTEAWKLRFGFGF